MATYSVGDTFLIRVKVARVITWDDGFGPDYEIALADVLPGQRDTGMELTQEELSHAIDGAYPHNEEG